MPCVHDITLVHAQATEINDEWEKATPGHLQGRADSLQGTGTGAPIAEAQQPRQPNVSGPFAHMQTLQAGTVPASWSLSSLS